MDTYAYRGAPTKSKLVFDRSAGGQQESTLASVHVESDDKRRRRTAVCFNPRLLVLPSAFVTSIRAKKGQKQSANHLAATALEQWQ